MTKQNRNENMEFCFSKWPVDRWPFADAWKKDSGVFHLVKIPS